MGALLEKPFGRLILGPFSSRLGQIADKNFGHFDET